MIDSQKHNIIALRQKGMSYGEIANKLEISINTIKSFCRRSLIELGKNICKHCGKPVEQNPGRREKKFCSDACRMKWWSAHPEMGKRSVRLVCPVCGKSVPADGHLVARLFNKTQGKKHVMIVGCSSCLKNEAK